MAMVFLSYDRDNADKAKAIALALEEAGNSVWWDPHVRSGAQYSKVIEEALKAADAVVVLWSKQSVESAWVRDEAAAGRDCGRLVPVTLDDTEPPLGFRQFQTIDLSGWNRRGKPRQLRTLLADIEAMAPASAPHLTPAGPSRGAEPARALPQRLLVGAIAALAIIIALAAVLLLRPWTRGNVPVVAVRPADSSTESRALARDLLVTLGTAQSSHSDPLQLVDENARQRPDLVLEVSGTASDTDRSANLVLLRAADRQVLSSQDLAVPRGEMADLKTSVAVSAMNALECATTALASRPQMPLDLLKQYLGACAQFAALYGNEDVSILIPQLENVVQRGPRFLLARKQLLLAGAFIHSIPTDIAKPSPKWFRAQIEAARRVEPAMPELRLAELELLPTIDFAGRLRLADGLREQFPDHMFVLGTRAEQLMLVGRNNEAVVDAERTARLNPLAPYSRSEYIRALAFSGRIPRAFEELNNFAPLSPIAMSLTDTRFRLNLRYGDPRLALKILRMYGTSKSHEAFLIARIEPSRQNITRSIGISRAIAAKLGYYGSHSEVLEAFGRGDEAYKMLMLVPQERVDQYTLQTLFRPTLKKLRQNPRFLRVAQRFGLLDYWKASGKWPDFCFEPDLPYDCRVEATKLAA